MDMDPRGPQIEKPKPAAVPKKALPLDVESPRERQQRILNEALQPNTGKGSARRAQEDIDRVFGRKAIEGDGSIAGGLRSGLDRLRTAPARRGESLAPTFDSIPVRMAMIQGDRASQDMILLERLGTRGERSVQDGGPAASVRDELLSDIQHAEDEGRMTPEDAASRRGEVLERYGQEVLAMEAALRLADERNRALADMVYGGDGLPLAEAGAMALARGRVMDLVVADHFRKVLTGSNPIQGPEALREDFIERLHLVTRNHQVQLELPLAQSALLESRKLAVAQAEKLLIRADSFGPTNPDDPDRKIYEQAKAEYLRVKNLSSPTLAGEDQGEIAVIALRQIQAEPEKEFEKIENLVEKQYSSLWEMKTSGQVDQETVERMSENLLQAEVAQTEVILAMDAHDRALIRYLEASEAYLARYESKVPAGLPLAEGLERRVPTSDEVRQAHLALLGARASAVEVRSLERARAKSEESFKNDAVAFIDRHLPLLEVPDNLPDLDIIKVQAAVVSGNMGTAEAWQRLSEVETRDLRERVQRMRAYASVVQNSLVGKTLGYVTHMGIVTTEHVAAMAWVLAKSISQVTTNHLTDLGKAIGTGKDAQSGIHGAMELFTVGGTSFGQAWAGLKLAQTVRNQRVQINMQRKQEVRERLENRRRELQEMVKDNRDGAERLASYLDQAKQFRENIKGVILAEPNGRDQALAVAVSTMETMQRKLLMLLPDHKDVYDQMQQSPDLSIVSLRAQAARALARNGLRAEGAAFDEHEAQRAFMTSHLGKVNVHQAVDAAAHLRDLVTAKDRTLDALNEELRSLISEKGFGSHGNLAGGLMLMDTEQGPVGVLFHPGNPPGVAFVPIRMGAEGEFQGFQGKPRVFDLADVARARAQANLEGLHDVPAKVLLNEFPQWAANLGVDRQKIEAIEAYMGACVDFKGLPLQSSLPQSIGYLEDLKASGILTVPTALDDQSIMPVDPGIEAYWKTYAGLGADTAKMQAAFETAGLGAWDQAIARQSVVAAISSRWREQEARKATV